MSPRLALVCRRSGASLGLICGVEPHRRRTLVTVLLPQGGVAKLKASHVKRVFWATPPLHLPRDWERRTHALSAELGRLSVRELADRERRQGAEGQLAAIECHQCPWGSQTRCDQAWKALERLETRLAQRSETLDTLRNAYWQEFCRVVKVLEAFRAVEGGKLLVKGQLIAGFRHDNELLVAEVVDRGLLDGASLPEAAALCSCLIEEARSGDPAAVRLFLRARPKLRRKVQDLGRAADAVHDTQRLHRVVMPVALSTGFMPSVFRWASGDDDWASIVEDSFGGHEGDLIRAMRRLIDLLRQLAEAPEVPPEPAALLGRAGRVIDRGIVLESALI
jgi:ATP-dependent RNA helicase HelY